MHARHSGRVSAPVLLGHMLNRQIFRSPCARRQLLIAASEPASVPQTEYELSGAASRLLRSGQAKAAVELLQPMLESTTDTYILSVGARYGRP